MKRWNKFVGYSLFALTGGLSVLFFQKLAQKDAKAPAPLSPALCFLQTAQDPKPIAQFDGKLISRETIPPDLYTAFLQIQVESSARLQELARKIALRMYDQKSNSTQGDGERVPGVANVAESPGPITITGEQAREYFEQNKSSFPGVTFDKVEKLIIGLLQKRENSLYEKSRIAQLENENRFHMLHSMPCGGKITPPYDNSLPARGNTTADLHLLYAFSFNCSQCRQANYELMKFVSQNVSKMRLWFLPVPGREGTRNYSFSSAFQCAFELAPSQIMDFNRILMEAPIIGSENDVMPQILKETETIGISAEKLQACMNSPKLKERLNKYQLFADSYGIEGDNPRYFLNERGMAPNIGVDVVKTLKLVFSERDRLKNVISTL